MEENFFQTYPLPTDLLNGIYDIRLVILSFLVAVFASYIALDFTGRLRDRNNTPTSSLLWLVGGSIAMGAGIWSMHFIGMLSFSIPGLKLQYDVFWTIFSLLVAVIASGFALALLKASIINVVHLVAGGIILGLAIASMHYTGMAAMLITLNIRYLPTLFFLSILIAIVASEAAIWFALKSNTVVLSIRQRIKIISAVIMGIAICGMHYTGMSASIFTPLCVPALVNTDSFDPAYLSIAIAAVTFIILGIAFFASAYKETINQQQFEKARQLGMAEISTSVLHNVGNVLNSLRVSAETISDTNASPYMLNLEKLCTLLNEHKHDLGNFVTQDPRGIKVLEFINKFTEYWRDEHHKIANEIEILKKNIMLINDIIMTQQNFSKPIGLEQLVSINDLLEEALLIIGIEFKKEIVVEKHYASIHAITTDKVKLLQIFVNLLRNAKEAVMESTKKNKCIIVKTSILKNGKIQIEIADNGIGILPANLNKIFTYGFTTKMSGHGFGLHTSALAINDLGGDINVNSAGLENGASFTLTLPYKNTYRL